MGRVCDPPTIQVQRGFDLIFVKAETFSMVVVAILWAATDRDDTPRNSYVPKLGTSRKRLGL